MNTDGRRAGSDEYEEHDLLTPEEISSRKFLNALRGYDRLEVSEFLNEVAEDYRDLLERVRELEAREERRTATGGEFDPREAIGELGEETKRILLAAEEAAEEKRTHAEEEARTKLEDARKTAADELEQARTTAAEELDAARRKAQETVTEAQGRKDEILAAINELVEARGRFSSQLREAADAVVETLRRVESLDEPDTGAAVADEEAVGDDEAVGDQEAVGDPEAVEAVEAPLEDAGHTPERAAQPAPAEEPQEPAEEEPADETVEGPSARQREAGDGGEPSGNVTVLEPDTDRPGDVVTPAEEQSDVTRAGADAAKLREEAVASIRPDMVQELKDAIQGMQSGLLERLRVAEDRESTVTPSDEEAERLEAIGRGYLSRAYQAGLSTGAVLAEADSGDVKGLDSRVEEGAGELRDAIVNELRGALSTTLREGAEQGESASQLSKRVKRSVRQLRNAVAEAAASTSLLRLHELGVHDAWSDLDVPARAWRVSDEEAECPDDVCAANAAEGAVALDATFPSGDLTPPAHPGCVCTLDPA